MKLPVASISAVGLEISCMADAASMQEISSPTADIDATGSFIFPRPAQYMFSCLARCDKVGSTWLC